MAAATREETQDRTRAGTVRMEIASALRASQ
jgi:hypothetical protein